MLPLADSLGDAIDDFSCIGPDDDDDPVVNNVNSFLVDRRFEAGIEHGISATHLLVDPEREPPLLGYATLTFDAVRLTNVEKKRMEKLADISEFGAVRIQMIGVDCRHQRTQCGTALLEGITGMTRQLSEHVAVRFLLADANVRKVEWYEQAGFIRNRAMKYKERPNPERAVSMRLDLLDRR